VLTPQHLTQLKAPYRTFDAAFKARAGPTDAHETASHEWPETGTAASNADTKQHSDNSPLSARQLIGNDVDTQDEQEAAAAAAAIAVSNVETADVNQLNDTANMPPASGLAADENKS